MAKQQQHVAKQQQQQQEQQPQQQEQRREVEQQQQQQQRVAKRRGGKNGLSTTAKSHLSAYSTVCSILSTPLDTSYYFTVTDVLEWVTLWVEHCSIY